jgi:hypothetical protein
LLFAERRRWLFTGVSIGIELCLRERFGRFHSHRNRNGAPVSKLRRGIGSPHRQFELPYLACD